MKGTVKLVALLLCVLCALCLAGCKNAAEDSGETGGSTPAGFQIKDTATFKAFASSTNSESYGVVVEDITLTETINFANAPCDKTVDLRGHTITCNDTLIAANGFVVTLCDTNTTKGTITGTGKILASTECYLIAVKNLSIKDGINITMNRDCANASGAVYVDFGGSMTELNANVSITNNGATSGIPVYAVYVYNDIANITGGSYTATSKDGGAYAIGATNVKSISAGKFKATTTNGTAYGIDVSGDVTSISDGVEFTAVGPSGSIHNKIGSKTSGYSAGVTFNPSLGT